MIGKLLMRVCLGTNCKRPLVDNLFLQVYGEKSWHLYEPQEVSGLMINVAMFKGENFYPFGYETKYSQ